MLIGRKTEDFFFALTTEDRLGPGVTATFINFIKIELINFFNSLLFGFNVGFDLYFRLAFYLGLYTFIIGSRIGQ